MDDLTRTCLTRLAEFAGDVGVKSPQNGKLMLTGIQSLQALAENGGATGEALLDFYGILTAHKRAESERRQVVASKGGKNRHASENALKGRVAFIYAMGKSKWKTKRQAAREISDDLLEFQISHRIGHLTKTNIFDTVYKWILEM